MAPENFLIFEFYTYSSTLAEWVRNETVSYVVNLKMAYLGNGCERVRWP